MKTFAIFSAFIVWLLALSIETQATLGQQSQIDMKSPFKLCRKLNTGKTNETYFASDNTSIYFLSNGTVNSFNVTQNSDNWKTDLGGRIIQNPYLFDEYLVVISEVSENNQYIVRLLYKNSGLAKWQTSLKTEKKVERMVDSKTRIFIHFDGANLVIVDSEANLWLLNPLNGQIVKEKSLDVWISTVPFFFEKQLTFGTRDKIIFQISTESLELLNRVSVATEPLTIFLNKSGLFYGDRRGELTALEFTKVLRKKNVKKKRILKTGGQILDISRIGGRLLVTSLDNFVYMISQDTGKIFWKQRLPNRPLIKPLIIDQHAVFLTVGATDALILELNEGEIINRIKTTEDLFFTGEMGILFPFIYFLSGNEILFYASRNEC